MIELTLADCVTAEAALTRLAAHNWPIRTAYKMGRLLRLLRVETKAFDDQRVALIRQLGETRRPTDAERARGVLDDVVEVPPSRVADFVRQFDELRSVPIRIDWTPLTVAEFGDGAQASAADLLDLGPLLTDV